MYRRLVNALAALAGAAMVSQFPAFYDQYLQRLGGRLDQAQIQVARIERAARAERMSLAAYVGVFLDARTSAHRRQGAIMLEQIADLERLRAAQAALAPARTLERPVRFAGHVEPGLARATLRDFTPGVPLTSEGAIYAAAGALAGLLAVAGIGRALHALARRARRA